MNETKHTPLPWIQWEKENAEGTRLSICHHIGPLESDDHQCVAEAEGKTPEETEANAQLIITSVNARPKVEMAVKTGKRVKWDDIFSLLDKLSKQEWTDRLYQLRSNLREVEAALKVSP